MDLLEVFREFNPTRMSNGQIRMMCPFRDNHPDGSGQYSFFISPEINAYHCFSCHAKGNLLRLLTREFGVSYSDAVGMVNIANFEKPAEKVFDLDVSWDLDAPPTEFINRGYTKETLRHFRVGTMEDGNILIPFYGSFTKRSSLLGYQKRWYDADGKHALNSKGFRKEKYLYNLTDSPTVILVEGQSDVWRLYQFGYDAVALMGADISQWQVEQLSKRKEVVLALDNDTAGRRGVEICNHLLQAHTQITLVPYDAKDPGECTYRKWKKAYEGRTDYVEYAVSMSLDWPDYLEMREKVLEEISKRSICR